MIGMLSALFSAHARLRICFHPRHGMSVGFSAWMPGSSCGLGASAGGLFGSGCELPAGAFARAPAAGHPRRHGEPPPCRLFLDALADAVDGALARPGAGHMNAPRCAEVT